MYRIIFILLGSLSLSFGQSLAPIFEAVSQNNIGFADKLMGQRAAVNITNENGMTPLHMASSAEMAHLLLVNGAEVNIQNYRGSTALHLAIFQNDENLLRVLFQFGADPNIADNKGNTPLHYAAAQGDNISIILLLQANANPNARNTNGDTPLIMCLQGKHLNSAYFLLMGGAQDIPNRAGERPAKMISAITSPDLLTALINPPTPPLIRAIFLEQYPEAIQMINSNTTQEINQQDIYGNTALHWAFQKRNKEISRLLINKSANRGLTNYNGQTAMDVLRLITDPDFLDFAQRF
ncbi:MAG: ankyrin repeat domain-containing protein [Brevinema sp.]